MDKDTLDPETVVVPAKTEEPTVEVEPEKKELTTEEVIDRAVEKLHSIRADGRQTKNGDTQMRSWAEVSDQELTSVLANPDQYKPYMAGAIGENNRRLRESILEEVGQAMEIKSTMSENKEAFDPNTPIGKKIQKIIGKKTNAQILRDAIELASYRQGKGKSGKKDVEKIIDGIKAASHITPGVDSKTNIETPSPAAMKKAEFENMVKSVKLRKIGRASCRERG